MKKVPVFLVLAILAIFSSALYAQVWTQIGLDIDGEAAGDESGNSIDLSADGNIIAIGAWLNDGNGVDAGHVRVFENLDGVWTQVGAAIEGEAGERKGYTVSLNDPGNIVALSTPYVNNNTGKVSIYENINGVWTQLGNDIHGIGAYYYSGYSIELSPDGHLIAISNHAQSGTIRLYAYVNDDWSLVGEITGRLYNEQLGGRGISFNKDASILAARSSTYAMVRVFEMNTLDDWKQVGDTIPNVHSSFSLSLDSLSVAVGNASWFGTASVFHNSNMEWTQKGNDMGGWFTGTGFAESVELSSDGNMLLVSASGDNYLTGRVRTYKFSSGAWTQLEDDIFGEDSDNVFGANLCLSSNDSILAVSASKNDEIGVDAGHVRIFRYRLPDIETDTSVSLCASELPYTFGTQTIDTAGTYMDTLTAGNGADSIVTLTLTVFDMPYPGFTIDADTLSADSSYVSYQWYDQDGLIEGATSGEYIIEKSGTFRLEVIDENGCSAISGGFEVIKTGMPELSTDRLQMQIFPNPNDGIFSLRFASDETGSYQVQIFNDLGQVIYEKEFFKDESVHEETINLAPMKAGNYYIRIRNDESSKTEKLILK